MPARIQAFTGILKTDLDKVFLVGGCVRDILSGRDPEDIDLLAVLPPKRLLDLGFTYVDPKTTIPVFTMHRGDLGKVEIALPRGKAPGPGPCPRSGKTSAGGLHHQRNGVQALHRRAHRSV
jgi:tRNA nucleotidyltransferase/poly(A) polymerase